jgi:hypothetical protein
MFSQLDNGSASHLSFAPPACDPLLDHDIHRAGALASGRTPFRPKREVRGDRTGCRMRQRIDVETSTVPSRITSAPRTR